MFGNRQTQIRIHAPATFARLCIVTDHGSFSYLDDHSHFKSTGGWISPVALLLDYTLHSPSDYMDINKMIYPTLWWGIEGVSKLRKNTSS